MPTECERSDAVHVPETRAIRQEQLEQQQQRRQESEEPEEEQQQQQDQEQQQEPQQPEQINRTDLRNQQSQHLQSKQFDMDTNGEMSTSQNSNSSANGHNGNSNGAGRKTSITSPDPTEYVAKQRVTRPTPPPPSYNPMQFVQIKPCNLYQTAQEQLKKAEEVKKIKEIKKEEPEDWQNNLDNWKSSRRKRVEHIIDRCVEVKKLEEVDFDRQRRKSKTFSEMMEERGERGGARGRVKLASLAVYNEDESNDLSDLGIGTSSASGKSSLSEDYDNNSVMSDNTELDREAAATIENNHNHKPNESTSRREYISSPGYDTSSSTAPASSPDLCEYTYEGAIQDYKQRVSRASMGSSGLKQNGIKSANRECSVEGKGDDLYPIRRGSKIEDRLIGFEVSSPSDNQDVVEKVKVDMPKVDISKRKEMFETANNSQTATAAGTGTATIAAAAIKPIAVPKVTLRNRFSANTATTNDNEMNKDVKRFSGDIGSIKERLQNLEQQKNANDVNGLTKSTSNTAMSSKVVMDIPVPPLKDRLCSLQNAVAKEDKIKKPPVALVDARQLEIMKNEEKRMQQQQQQQKQAAQPNQTTVLITEAPIDDLNVAQQLKQQEEQLNAAIAALALEEQQLEAAANAANQNELEFAELASASLTEQQQQQQQQPMLDMECSINEALELALQAIDEETHTTSIAATTTNTTAKSTTRKINQIEIQIQNNKHTVNNVEKTAAITTKTAATATTTINQKNRNEPKMAESNTQQKQQQVQAIREPIYENISTASTQDLEADKTETSNIIPLTNKQIKQNNQAHSEINDNEYDNNNRMNQTNSKSESNNSNSNNNDNNINNNNSNNHSISISSNSSNDNTELTAKAFSNKTQQTIITTTTATANIKTISTAKIIDDITESNNNNTTSITSSYKTQLQTPPNTPNTPETLNSTIAISDAPIEPYYQVPQSSEPYYDAPKHLRPVPVYENIDVIYNGLDISTLASLSLGNTMLEPPKEKPPPPPASSPPPAFDDVDSIGNNTDTWSSDNTYETISSQHPNNFVVNNATTVRHHPSPPIKRMNSTKRIKKELRNKRSSFLGIETSLDDDDTYLELTVAPPPDMAQLLQEERRLEKQFYIKAGLCDSSDTGESRDSGVSENHSRQSSEHYTNSSEENDRNIESPLTATHSQTIYQNEALLSAAQTPLLQTVKGNSAESWTESATAAAAASKSLCEATATANAKIHSIEEKMREQEEVLRVEKELLQLEQEELKRQRENLIMRENMVRRELQHGAKMLKSANRHSLQDLNINAATGANTPFTLATAPVQPLQQPQQIYANVPQPQQQQQQYYQQTDADYRKSMSDLNEFSKRMVVPPTPPTKPLRAMHVTTNGGSQHDEYATRQRHSLNTQQFGGSLVKIATPTVAPRLQPVYSNYHHQSAQNLTNAATSPTNGAAYAGNMTRNKLHALSAVPKPKYTDGWVQVQNRNSFENNLANDAAWMSAQQQKRKSMPDGYQAYNNHWLVQEAEQRRLTEQQQRRSVPQPQTTQSQSKSNGKPLPDAIIQTLTERVQSKGIGERKRFDHFNQNQSNNLEKTSLHAKSYQQQQQQHATTLNITQQTATNSSTYRQFNGSSQSTATSTQQQDKVLSVSGKKKCSHCGDELGRGAAMIIESLLLFYHINCFKCCVCHVQLGDGLNGTDVRVRNHKLHCQNCYSSDDGIKFSCV